MKRNGYRLIFKYFHMDDEEKFQKFVGLSTDTFDYLFTLTEYRLQRKRRVRVPLEPELRLAVVIK